MNVQQYGDLRDFWSLLSQEDYDTTLVESAENERREYQQALAVADETERTEEEERQA